MTHGLFEILFTSDHYDYARMDTSKLQRVIMRLEQDLLLSRQYERESTGWEKKSHKEMSKYLAQELHDARTHLFFR